MTELTRCLMCGFAWDDTISTGKTPVPSGRTPCEYYHKYDDRGAFVGLDRGAIADDANFIREVRGTWDGWQTEMNADERFFYDHAGWATPPGREECARSLAAAESERKRRGWWLTVEHDPYVMPDDAGSVESVERGDAVNLEVTLYRGTEDGPDMLTSLAGVVVASEDDPYVRVVAAELAAEALANEAIAGIDT